MTALHQPAISRSYYNQKKMSIMWGLKGWILVKLVVIINQATLKLINHQISTKDL